MSAGPGSIVFVTEGEKNADDLIKARLLATTVISHIWTEECVAALAGYELIILEDDDDDDDGRKYASKAQELLAKVAKSVRVVSVAHLWERLDPKHAALGAAKNADVSDWIELGGDPKS
jgi:hypothetical protein